jgi:putative transposase
MIRSFHYRLRPNAAQAAVLDHILADSQETYNAALQERRDAWKTQRKSVTLYEQFGELTEIRKESSFAVISCDIQREPLRRVDRAFKAFFRRCKEGGKPGFPRFRSRDRYDSFAFSLPVVLDRSIKVPNLGDIRANGCRPLQGRPKLCTVKRVGKQWIAIVACDIGPAPEKAAVSKAVGIDVGLTKFITLSDGRAVDNPHWTRQHEGRIARANRRLATKKRGSKNLLRAKELLRRAHQRAADARKNFTHHVSKWLVQNYDLIAFEKLNIAGMAQDHFAKSILDAAWGLLLFQVTYKAENAGKWAVPVNPRGTSQRCSGCGETVKKELWQRQHNCPSCGLSLDRDHNASLNILALGQSAAGIPAKSIQGYSCI